MEGQKSGKGKRKSTEEPLKAKKTTKKTTKTNSTSKQDDSSDSEESDEMDREICAVCRKFYPDEFVASGFKKTFLWAQCDACDRWVHLRYCTPVKVLRRGDNFKCPLCTSSP